MDLSRKPAKYLSSAIKHKVWSLALGKWETAVQGTNKRESSGPFSHIPARCKEDPCCLPGWSLATLGFFWSSQLCLASQRTLCHESGLVSSSRKTRTELAVS